MTTTVPDSATYSPHVDIGCYVVDALDPAGRVAFEAHLAECESCSGELFEFTETSAELARLATMGPPGRVRGSMLSGIRAVRPLPPVVELPLPLPLVTVTSASEKPARPAELPNETGRPRAWRTRLLVGLVAAVSVLIVALGGVVVALHRQPQHVTTAAVQRSTELLSAPDATVYRHSGGGGHYTFVVSRQRQEAMVIATDLPDPGAGKAYQLWTLHGDRATADVTAFALDDSQWFGAPIGDATGLAVTIEPAGGSVQPTSAMLARVVL